MKRGGDPRHVLAVTGLAIEARIASGPGVAVLASGGDARRLPAALEQAARDAVALISFGIAGALADDLPPGAWIVARAVVTAAGRVPADVAWTRALAERLAGAVVADVTGTDAIAATSGAKQALRASTGGVAVDTESHVVAEVARACGLPFAVFRVVSDPVHRALPPAALVPLRARGGVDGPAVLRSLARSPAQLPSLARTALDTALALRALSTGRRRLGRYLGYPDLGKLLLDVA